MQTCAPGGSRELRLRNPLPVVDAIHPLRFASLIYWSLGNQQLSDGLHPTDGIVLVAVGVMLIAVAHAGLRRLDIH
jgi:ABC-2 type transport system permease protein